jgi:hypothetical protein
LVDQDDEYEPAPGALTRCREYNGSLLWSHGNFVARRKRSGCFSFLPAPLTLFFFELLDRDAKGAIEVITCIPIGLYLLASSFMHPYICCHDLYTTTLQRKSSALDRPTVSNFFRWSFDPVILRDMIQVRDKDE